MGPRIPPVTGAVDDRPRRVRRHLGHLRPDLPPVLPGGSRSGGGRRGVPPGPSGDRVDRCHDRRSTRAAAGRVPQRWTPTRRTRRVGRTARQRCDRRAAGPSTDHHRGRTDRAHPTGPGHPLGRASARPGRGPAAGRARTCRAAPDPQRPGAARSADRRRATRACPLLDHDPDRPAGPRRAPVGLRSVQRSPGRLPAADPCCAPDRHLGAAPGARAHPGRSVHAARCTPRAHPPRSGLHAVLRHLRSFRRGDGRGPVRHRLTLGARPRLRRAGRDPAPGRLRQRLDGRLRRIVRRRQLRWRRRQLLRRWWWRLRRWRGCGG